MRQSLVDVKAKQIVEVTTNLLGSLLAARVFPTRARNVTVFIKTHCACRSHSWMLNQSRSWRW